MKQTLGESRVRLGFNPSQNTTVDEIKRKTAELIDLCEQIKADAASAEATRCCALAQTHYEDAAMWAVKAATT